MIKRMNILNDNHGAALIWALIVFAIMSILVMSSIFIANQDILETTQQIERIEAYYVALSGVDLGYAALMADKDGDLYIEQFADDEDKTVSHTFTIQDGSDTVGTAVVTIDSVEIDSFVWIRITSVGTMQDTGVSVQSIMRINPDNHKQIIRERNTL